LPFFAITLIYGDYQYALIIFITASVTDVLDGFIARLKRQITVFGSILDPVADKFLLVTSFIIMTIYGWIPKWLTIIVISREIIIVTGWLILYFVTHSARVEPSLLGKITNALQFILIGLTLLSINIRGGSCNIESEACIPGVFLLMVAISTSVSGLQYIYKGLKIANTEDA
jgi:cardiolipin synthase